MSYVHKLQFPQGSFLLKTSLALENVEWSALAFRKGTLMVENERELEVCLTHSAATEAFIYTGETGGRKALDKFLDTRGLVLKSRIPGQFILGAERTRLTMAGVADCMRSPSFGEVFSRYKAGEIAAFPVLREGTKYGLGEALMEVGGLLCDEIVVDAHHEADDSVPGLGRRMELTIFKDRDLSPAERNEVRVAVIGDSVASGTIIVGLVEEIAKRFPNLERVELVAPLAAVYGLARIAAFARHDLPVRIHCFETVLNALPPDYYYSPHFADPRMHISTEAQRVHREWWGRDRDGNFLADTACAGYGWSEAFFNPGKQLRMIEEELERRHGMSLRDLICDR